MKFWKEFKAFISRGNIVDLAIGVIIGTAFNKIVTSLVNDIIMPLITWALGAESLADLSIVLQRDAEGIATLTWNYGNFIQTLIDFLIVALTIFVALKIMMKSSKMFKDMAGRVRRPSKEEKQFLVDAGVNLKDKKAVKEALARRNAEILKAKAEEEAKQKEEAYKNSTEGLLKEIRDLLKENRAVGEAENKAENGAEPIGKDEDK